MCVCEEICWSKPYWCFPLSQVISYNQPLFFSHLKSKVCITCCLLKVVLFSEILQFRNTSTVWLLPPPLTLQRDVLEIWFWFPYQLRFLSPPPCRPLWAPGRQWRLSWSTLRPSGPKWSKWQRKCGCGCRPIPQPSLKECVIVWCAGMSLSLSSGCWWRGCQTLGHIFLTVCIYVSIYVSMTILHWQVEVQLWDYFNCFLSVIPDIGFEIPDRFVVGYALDYNEYFRDLNVRSQTRFCGRSLLNGVCV